MPPGLVQFSCMLLLKNSALCLCRSHKWTRSWTSSQTCCIIWFPVSRGIRATTDHLREATAASVLSFSSPTTPCPPTSSWQYRQGTRMTSPDVLQVSVGLFLLFSYGLRRKGLSVENQGEIKFISQPRNHATAVSTPLVSNMLKLPTVAKGLPGCLPPGKTSGSSTLILLLNKWSQLISQKDQNDVKTGKMARI